VPLHVGRRTIVVQTAIYGPDGKRVALVTQTQLVIPKERNSASA
jgi:acyl-coenzyme A thioesterase PaaI-like protein